MLQASSCPPFPKLQPPSGVSVRTYWQWRALTLSLLSAPGHPPTPKPWDIGSYSFLIGGLPPAHSAQALSGLQLRVNTWQVMDTTVVFKRPLGLH